MLFLLFHLGTERYALDARQIAEVLPVVAMTAFPQSPRGVVGVCNYRGAPVPVIDLSELTLGRSAHRRLSTRLIVIHYPDGSGGRCLLALLAENATETMRRDPAEFAASGVNNERAPYLGRVATDARGFIQWIDVDQLLPVSVRDVLFRQPQATG